MLNESKYVENRGGGALSNEIIETVQPRVESAWDFLTRDDKLLKLTTQLKKIRVL